MIQKLFSLLGYEKKTKKYNEFEPILFSLNAYIRNSDNGARMYWHENSPKLHYTTNFKSEDLLHQYIYDRGVKAVIEEIKKDNL